MIKKKQIKLSFGEELGNSITHGVAALMVLFALPVVSIIAHEKGTVRDVVGVNIFGISIFLMFLMSTLYHAMAHDTKHKDILHILDHIFIYVAIAGTYTPIALSVLGGWQSIVVLIVQWVMVIFGILYKSIALHKMPKASLMIYLVMGWTVVFFMPMLIQQANLVLFWLIFSGGIFYSAGAFFYAKKGVKFFHMIWHLFVFFGAVTHFVGIGFFLYK